MISCLKFHPMEQRIPFISLLCLKFVSSSQMYTQNEIERINVPFNKSFVKGWVQFIKKKELDRLYQCFLIFKKSSFPI